MNRSGLGNNGSTPNIAGQRGDRTREREKQKAADQVHDAQYVLIGVKCVLKLNAYECQFK